MCGIAGYCGPATRFSDEKLKRMLTAIQHRGPDDEGLYSADVESASGMRVWLGARRLAIQDLSPAGHQPMIEPVSQNAIAFNGEIYNFLDLRRELIGEGYGFRSNCDTEVALKSWCCYGDAAFDRWRGMFGVALWNQRSSQLRLVRDHWGIKPLYYWKDGEALLFCSEVRGLLASGLIPRRISHRGLHGYLQFGAAQDPVTLIEGVYALLPGHKLSWSRGRIDINALAQPVWNGPAEVEGLDQLLRDIVRQQLVSDVPVGVFLSGGIDSSIVALLSRQEAGERINSVSLVFEETAYSERDYARAVARHIGTRHHEVSLNGAEIQAKVTAAIERMDQPSVDGINSYVICEAAKTLGFPVVLSGLGGDEFFGGYGTFRATATLNAVRRCASYMPRLTRFLAHFARPIASRAGSAALRLNQLLEHDDFREHLYMAQRRLLFESQISDLSLSGVESGEADRLAAERLESLLNTAQMLDETNQISFLEARMYMANMLLRDSDQMSMAHSIELRVPFVDQLLAAFLFSVPGRRKGFGSVPKLWLRSTYASSLPAEVFMRRKMGFTLPFSEWLRGPMRGEMEQTLLAPSGGLWDTNAVAGLWNDFLRGHLHWTRPWALYVFKRWISLNAETCPDFREYPEPFADPFTHYGLKPSHAN